MTLWLMGVALASADPAVGVQPPSMGLNAHLAMEIPAAGQGAGFGVFVQLPIFLTKKKPLWVLTPEFGWNVFEFDYSYVGSARDGLTSGTRLGGIYGGVRFSHNVWHSRPKVAGKKKKKKKAPALGRSNFTFLADVGPLLYGGGQFVVETSAVTGWKKPLGYIEPGAFVHFQLGPVGVGVIASQRLMFGGPDPVEPWTTVGLELDFAGLGLLELLSKK